MPEWVLTIWEIGLRVLAWLTIPLTALSVFLMVRTLKKPHVVKVGGLLLQAFTPFVTLAVYAVILGVAPVGWLSAILLIAGVGLGVARSRSTVFELHGGRVWGTRSGVYLIIWGVAFALTQTLVVVAPTELAQYGYSSLYLAVGTALAVNFVLLIKRQRLVAGVVGVPAEQPGPTSLTGGAVCPHCGGQVAPGAHFCPSCGRAIEGG